MGMMNYHGDDILFDCVLKCLFSNDLPDSCPMEIFRITMDLPYGEHYRASEAGEDL